MENLKSLLQTDRSAQVQQAIAEIYEIGAIAYLQVIHDAFVQIAKHDPLSAHLASELEEIILYQEEPIAKHDPSQELDRLIFGTRS